MSPLYWVWAVEDAARVINGDGDRKQPTVPWVEVEELNLPSSGIMLSMRRIVLVGVISLATIYHHPEDSRSTADSGYISEGRLEIYLAGIHRLAGLDVKRRFLLLGGIQRAGGK